MSGTKTYLGDAVYCDMGNGMLLLTVEYGEGPTETIYLEPEVYARLAQYARDVAGINLEVIR